MRRREEKKETGRERKRENDGGWWGECLICGGWEWYDKSGTEGN